MLVAAADVVTVRVQEPAGSAAAGGGCAEPDLIPSPRGDDNRRAGGRFATTALKCPDSSSVNAPAS